MLEKVFAGERDADAAPAEEWVRLRVGEGFGGDFVASGVEGADDGLVWAHLPGDTGVDFCLRVLVRDFPAFEEVELGAEEADAFGAGLPDHGEFVDELDVGGEGDAVAVAGGGFFLAQGVEFFLCLGALCELLSVVLDGFRGRIDDWIRCRWG